MWVHDAQDRLKNGLNGFASNTGNNLDDTLLT